MGLNGKWLEYQISKSWRIHGDCQRKKCPEKVQSTVTRCRQHLYWFLFSLCGSSESIKPDEWFQIFWYFCDQSQRVLRWGEQKRRKRKKMLFELMVSMPILNHIIQFWIQFKTPHSYLQGLEKVRPSPP